MARDQGFDRCGVAPAERIRRAGYLRAWLDAGRAGSMQYMHRYFSQRVDPRELLPGARSVIVVALLYHQRPPPRPAPDQSITGRVAMYAWGDDYHDVMKKRLSALVDTIRAELSEPFEARACVDTAPVLERELAAAAGIGWIGKNTLVLHPDLGSYFFLGEIVTTLDLTPDPPMPDHCGTCTACLEACPTDAFPAPYEMDASRCISYLTIEHRSEVDEQLQPLMDDWIFGCDVCQEVCPHNRAAPTAAEARFAIRPPSPYPDLETMAHWTVEDYRATLKGSAMKRAKQPQLVRNAGIALENVRRGVRDDTS